MTDRVKNLLSGVGSVLVIFPPLDVEAESRVAIQATDAQALAADWESVGNDLKSALAIVAHEHEQEAASH